MIGDERVAEIERLLARGGLSQRQIAGMAGVSRTFVNAVYRGKHRKRSGARDAAADSLDPPGPPQRCPACGARVYLPCVACRARAFKAGYRG